MGAKLPAVIPPKGDVSKLILPDTGGGGTVNPTLKRNEVRTKYDYMTDREAAVYKYYRDRGQVEKAQEYLDALEMDVNQRAAMQKREDAKKLAEESTAAALYARAVGNIGQAAGAVYAAAMEGADKPVDPYHPLMGGVNMNEGLAEGLMGDSTGAEKFAKEAGLAVFDWGTQAAALGPLTPYVMAAGAAAGGARAGAIGAAQRGQNHRRRRTRDGYQRAAPFFWQRRVWLFRLLPHPGKDALGGAPDLCGERMCGGGGSVGRRIARNFPPISGKTQEGCPAGAALFLLQKKFFLLHQSGWKMTPV